MASSTSNLQNYIQQESRQVGCSADAHSFPANQSTVLQLLSQPKEMPYKQLCKAVESLPEDARLTQSQLDGTLYELIRMGYLASFMENGDVIYILQVEIGKKPPAQRHEQRLLRKLDLSELNLDELSHLKKEDTNP